mgnify:CR=1 FL=1
MSAKAAFCPARSWKKRRVDNESENHIVVIELAIEADGEKINKDNADIAVKDGMVVKVGKRKYFKIVVKSA